MSFTLHPITQREAFAFVKAHHRHHKPPTGAVACIACKRGDALIGVAVIGRPVARMNQDGRTAEVTRLCVIEGHPNAASWLLTRAARAAHALGYTRVLTYTIDSEPGSSLFGAGWKDEGPAGGGSWSRPSRERADPNPTVRKRRWSKTEAA